MSILLFIAVIVLAVMISNLKARVHKLEQTMVSGVEKPAQALGAQVETSKFNEEQQPVTVEPSIAAYITRQLARGASREEIKNAFLASGWQPLDVENKLNTVISGFTPSPTPPFAPAGASQPSGGPSLATHLGRWLMEDWLLKLGALLLLIGFGWLTTYAFLNNWIGPMGRIAFGIIAGSLFMVLGWWRTKKYIHQGGIFMVLGSTVVLLTVFAGQEIYGFFNPLSALGIMFLSTSFVALASVKYNSRSLALASLILAGVAPLLTKWYYISPTGLFAYLLVIVLGTIWIATLTGRRELTTAALVLIGLYSLPYLTFNPVADMDALLLFAYAFAVVFFFTNTLGLLRLKGNDIWPDLITAAGNGLFLLAWILVAADDQWKSLIIAAWMVVFTVGAFIIFKATERKEPFYVYAGVGVAMLAAATAVELSGPALTIAYTIESGLISLISYLILRNVRVAEQLSFLLIGPIILSLDSVTSVKWSTGVIHSDFFVLAILCLTLFSLGLYYAQFACDSKGEKGDTQSHALLVVGSIYAYTILWLSLHAIFPKDMAVMTSLIVYTIVGLTAYFSGISHEKKNLRNYGGIMLGIVVGRLLLVDVWSMDLTGRIITFFLIGLLLMSTAFLGKWKKKNVTLSPNVEQKQ